MSVNPLKKLPKIWNAFTLDEQDRMYEAAAFKTKTPLSIKKFLKVVDTAQIPSDISMFNEMKLPGSNKTFETLCAEYKTRTGHDSPVIARLNNLRAQNQNQNAFVAQAFDKCKNDVVALDNQMKIESYNPIGVHNFLNKKKNLILKAVATKQAEEKTGLTALFQNPQFTQELSELGINLGVNNASLPEIQTCFEGQFTNKSQEKKSGFEKDLNSDLTQIDNTFPQRYYQYTFNKEMYLNAEYFGAMKFKQAIDQKLAQQFPNVQLSLQEHNDALDAIFSNMTPQEAAGLGALVTTTGLPITLEKRTEKDKNGVDQEVTSLKVQLRPWYKSPFYNPINDIQSLMRSARAQGIEPLHISLTSEDVEYDKDGKLIGGKGLKLAKIAYCEAIKAGYKPEDIKLKINDKPADTKDEKKYFTSDDLFANDRDMLKNAQDFSKRLQQQIDDHKSPVEMKNITTKIRQDLNPNIGADQDKAAEKQIKQGLG